MSVRDVVQAAAGALGGATYIEDVFSTWLYTGNGSTQTITNGIDLAGEGGLVWTKRRPTVQNHLLFDTARGVGNRLNSNTTNANEFSSFTLTSFNNNGFSLGFSADTNANNSTFASWTFRKAEKFFDVVTWSGNGSGARNIPHNLGSTPGFYTTKITNVASNWHSWHRSLSSGYGILLNSTNAASTSTDVAGATETYISVTSSLNINGENYVAYIFAHDAGGFGDDGSENVISCGSFTTDGSGNATVSLGYEPQYVMYKRSDGTGSWLMFDNMRGMTVNTTNGDAILFANLSDAESTVDWIQPTATGFNPYNIAWNATYIYIAIRRGPMKTPESGTEVFSPNTIGAVSVGTPVTTGFPVDLQIPTWRGGVSGHYVYDRLRGVSSSTTEGAKSLQTQSTSAEATVSTATRMWGNTGFQVDTSWSNSVSIFWNFRRAPGFFDEVCYTGNSVAGTTVAHNLAVVPELMIVKSRSQAGSVWAVYTAPTGATKYMRLENTMAAGTATSFWNNTSPTASVFTLGTQSDVNNSGSTFVAYLFATCPGVSKVGSYTGTAATQQINCGFTGGARFVLIKRTDSTGDWYVWDSARGIVAGNDPYLLLNSTAAEVTSTDYVDTYSAGFEISSTAPAAINANGGTFIFLAIA